MPEDEMAESEISARLRRLREEGEREQRTRFGGVAYPMPLPGSELAERRRAPDAQGKIDNPFVPVEVDVLKAVSDENGPRVIKETVSTVADSSAGAFEWLIHKGWIQRKEDRDGMGQVRSEAGLRFRSLVEDANVTPLRAQNYEGSGGGGDVKDPATHTIDCMKHLRSIEREVGAEQLAPVRAVVCDDVRIWDGKNGQGVRVEVDRVLKGLDHLAVYFSLLTPEELRQRWSAGAKKAAASRRPAASASSEAPHQDRTARSEELAEA